MRVLYLNQTAQVSGAEHSLLSLLQGLDGAVERLAACPSGELAELLLGMGIEADPIRGTRASFRLHPLHTAQGLADIGLSTVQVRRVVERRRPDLVYANTTRAALLALLARRRGGPPVLAHIRDWAPEGRLSQLVLGLIARRAEAVVATSRFIASQFAGLPVRGGVRVINDPIDLERFDPALDDGAAVRRELGISAGTAVLTLVGQVSPLKGHDDAIEALASLVSSGRDAVLLIVGSVKFSAPGAQLDSVAFGERLHTMVRRLELEGRVLFLGERSDVPDVLAATELLLMPFWRDAFGRVAVEAMAMGVPVVASDVGGPAEIVRDGVDGVLVPPRDPAAWTRTLESLLAERGLRERLGEEARRRSRDFGVGVHVAAMLDLYRELVPRLGAPVPSL